MKSIFSVSITLLAMLWSSLTATVQAQSDSWKSLTDDSTLMVIRMDMTTLSPMTQLGVAGLAEFQEDILTSRISWLIGQAQKSGAAYAYVMMSTSDRWDETPLLVLDMGEKQVDVETLIKRWDGRFPGSQAFQQHQGLWVLAGGDTHQRLASNSSRAPTGLVEALDHAKGGHIQAAFRLNDDARQVIRQLIHQVPSELADDLQWASLKVDLQWAAVNREKVQEGPPFQFQITLQHSGNELATKSQQWIQTAKDRTSRPNPKKSNPATDLLKFVQIHSARDQVIISGPYPGEGMSESLEELAGVGVAIRKFKALGLAAHNYHDSFGAFPAVFPEDAHKTKLGWRVALLPYLGETTLYDQFHHDEPWDSPHNLTLVEKMPSAYWLPGMEFQQEEGKTCIQAASGPGGLFFQPKVQFRDITDGSSNTIMFFEVNDDHAEIWTKPGGMPVPKDAESALGGHYGNRVVIGRADGSVESMRRKQSPEFWNAFFSPTGGEVVRQVSDE